MASRSAGPRGDVAGLARGLREAVERRASMPSGFERARLMAHLERVYAMSAKSDPAPRYFRTVAELRSWLEKNHDSASEVWVGFYNQRSGKTGITQGSARRSALLRLDRRRAQERGRGALSPALHRGGALHVERRQHQARRRAGGGRAHVRRAAPHSRSATRRPPAPTRSHARTRPSRACSSGASARVRRPGPSSSRGRPGTAISPPGT